MEKNTRNIHEKFDIFVLTARAMYGRMKEHDIFKKKNERFIVFKRDDNPSDGYAATSLYTREAKMR